MLPSLELATEDHSGLIGACDRDYGCIYMNTLSWRTPTTPLPMEINPRKVFERMFGQGGSAAARLARTRQDRSILDAITEQAGRSAAQARRSAIARRSTSISRAFAKSNGGFRWPAHEDVDAAAGAARRAGRHSVFVRRAHEADVRPAGARLPGQRHAGLHVHGGSRDQQPDVSAGRRPRRASRDLASPEPGREDGEERQDPDVSHQAVCAVPGEAANDAGRRRLAAGPFDHSLRQQHEQQQRAQPFSAADSGGRRRRRAASRAAVT